MRKLKSARHHWWPQCVSSRWATDDGTIGCIMPDGKCIRVTPKNLAVIRNAHHIKLSSDPNESTHWDNSFETEFDQADGSFPSVISWLESLNHKHMPNHKSRGRFLAQPASDVQLRLLSECVVSLAVRSPMNREASVSLAESLRGDIPNQERNALIGLNMKNSQRLIADGIGEHAKFAVLISQGREFIFGDGFFHNLRAVNNPPLAPKILVPITPNMSVILTRPTSFAVEPRISTIILSDKEVDVCNSTIQIYSRQFLFFRSNQPTIEESFADNEHQEYSCPDNPIDNLFCSIPGVAPRDKSLDFLLRPDR